ncbi:hypothetical protein V8G54_015926 [Vigna mungo]|uniref:Uncharacterized protein n=1 Tax=Vigna mungo TaxID=3915 RepID=A0AAQ3NK89_VIGMU
MNIDFIEGQSGNFLLPPPQNLNSSSSQITSPNIFCGSHHDNLTSERSNSVVNHHETVVAAITTTAKDQTRSRAQDFPNQNFDTQNVNWETRTELLKMQIEISFDTLLEPISSIKHKEFDSPIIFNSGTRNTIFPHAQTLPPSNKRSRGRSATDPMKLHRLLAALVAGSTVTVAGSTKSGGLCGLTKRPRRGKRRGRRMEKDRNSEICKFLFWGWFEEENELWVLRRKKMKWELCLGTELLQIRTFEDSIGKFYKNGTKMGRPYENRDA